MLQSILLIWVFATFCFASEYSSTSGGVLRRLSRRGHEPPPPMKTGTPNPKYSGPLFPMPLYTRPPLTLFPINTGVTYVQGPSGLVPYVSLPGGSIPPVNMYAPPVAGPIPPAAIIPQTNVIAGGGVIIPPTAPIQPAAYALPALTTTYQNVPAVVNVVAPSMQTLTNNVETQTRKENTNSPSLGEYMVIAATITSSKFSSEEALKLIQVLYPNQSNEFYQIILNNTLISDALKKVEVEKLKSIKSNLPASALTRKAMDYNSVDENSVVPNISRYSNDENILEEFYEQNDNILNEEELRSNSNLKYPWCAVFMSHPLCK